MYILLIYILYRGDRNFCRRIANRERHEGKTKQALAINKSQLISLFKSS